MFARMRRKAVDPGTLTPEEQLSRLLKEADAVIIGAGAGLSTSAGFTYTGERFRRYFSDFEETHDFHDMYSGGFYPYKTFEEHWAYWSRYIYVNRYMDPPKPVYHQLYRLVRDTDYFVLTTNVDHCFQKAGFSRKRLFYTQGDYGLFQCSEPCHKETYENEAAVRAMLEAQGFAFDGEGTLLPPRDGSLKRQIPSELVPRCPKCGKPMSMNLRADGTFVEDSGWEDAAIRFNEFLRRHQNLKTVFLELGTGMNTPAIIKFPFWRMTYEWPDASYVCINLNEAYAPEEIRDKSLCFQEDIGEVLRRILS